MLKSIIVICFLFFAFNCASVKRKEFNNTEVLPASALKPYGRFAITNNGELELISSAVHFGFSFEGKECQVQVRLSNANGHNYLQYTLDGVYQKRIRVAGNSSNAISIAAPAAGKHTVWIYKATEAHTGPVFISGIKGQQVKFLQKEKLPLIEFIGNSITCGAAADASEIPCGTGEYHDQHNAYFAYGPRVARALQADYILSSVSGIGIYRNWNSDGPTMPVVYEKTDFQEGGNRQWDFGAASPKVVSIALGTNDFSGGDGVKKRLPFDSVQFVKNYILFVQQVKLKHPTAQIVLLSSAMVNGNNRTLLQNCLTAVKKNIDVLYTTNKPVQLYFFKPMQARGCTGHPSVEDHAILAAELEPFFKQFL